MAARSRSSAAASRPMSLTALLFVFLLLATACGPRFDREALQVAAAPAGATGQGEVALDPSTDGGIAGDLTPTSTDLPSEGATEPGAGATELDGSGQAASGSGAVGSGSTGSGSASTGGGTGQSGGSTGSPGGTSGSGSTTTDPGPAPGITDDGIVIGYLLPLTGAAPLPAGFDKGVRVYWEWLNANGGVHGRKVTVNIYDTESSTSNAVAEARRAVQEDKVFTLLSLDRLEVQDAIANFLEQVGMPHLMVQSPANPPAAWKNTFIASVDHIVQGRGIATFFAQDLKAANGAKKVGFVREQTSALKPGTDAFEQRAAQEGLEVVARLTTDPANNDQSGVVSQLIASGAEIVWLYMAPTPAANIIKSSGARLFQPIWFANNISWQFELVNTLTAPNLNGSYAFSSWVPLSDKRADKYKAEYRAQNGATDTPDDLGLVGWGAGEVVSAMLDAAGPKPGWNTFRQAIASYDKPGNVWTGLDFTKGPIGANVVKVYQSDGNRWNLVQDDRVLQ